MHQRRILAHIPPVRRQHVLRPLVQDAVERAPRDIEGQAVCAGVELHLAQIRVIIQVGQDTPALRIVLQVV